MQKNDKSIKSYVIERTTGEVMDSIMEGDRIRITRKEKVEFLESTISIPFTSFAKLNTAEIAFLAKELSKPDFVFLLSLSDFVGYHDNCIKNRRGVPMSVEDIAARLGISRATAYRSVERLMKENILCKAKTSEFQLFVCPLIYCKGNRTNKVLQTMFRNYRVRSKGNAKWQRLLE